MSEHETNTEGPTPSNEAAPAGGVDLARDAAREAEGDSATPESTPAPAPETIQEPSEGDKTTSGEPVVDEAPVEQAPDTEAPEVETAQ